MKMAQPLTKPFKHVNRPIDGVLAEYFLLVQPGRKSNGLFEAVYLINLACAVFVMNATNREPKAVGAEVNGCQ